MRKFKELRESVYSHNGANVPDATDGLDSVGIYRIENPQVLARINAVVQACFSMPVSDVRMKMADLRHKLNIAGYDLDLSQFRPVEGQYKIPLNRFGGRYGFDMEKGRVTADDGIEPFAGYKMSLNVTVTLDNFSFYRIEGSIQPDGTSEEQLGERYESGELSRERDERVDTWYESLRTFLMRTESVADAVKKIKQKDESVRGVRKNDGPFTVVAMKGKKVMNQFKNAEFSELKDVITMMKTENKGAKISVESKGGKIVHTESVELDEDKQSARELQLFVDNDRQIYTRRMMPIFKNLMSKRAAGKYDPKLATKLFMYAMDDGAKAYVKMHDAPGAKWNKVFDKQTRMMAADNARREFEGEADLGSYDEMIPKKYRK